MSTLETQYKNFLKDNPNTKLPFEEWEKVNARLIKQAIINMMKADEELELYDEPFKHKVEAIPAEEILANRSNAYEFIDFDLGLDELNPYTSKFLYKNGFLKKAKGDIYTNPKCTITFLDDCYQIAFNHSKFEEVSMYTESSLIYHLIGILTWYDLIDRNYKK